MKKQHLLLVLGVSLFALAGCGNKNEEPSSTPSSVEQTVKHTVQFYVEDELYKTLKVENNKSIGSSSVENPLKEGFTFVSWVDKDNEVVDLDTYVVTDALKLYATFEEVVTDDTLIVDGTKEAGVDYYLVVGWWEVVGTNEDGTPKVTSSLTVDTVRMFYANLNMYLEAYGATDAQLDLVQFRDYSTEAVAEMGEKINTDADVDLVIGVGNNINSSAGVSLFEGNDGKTTAPMGTELKSRYVALPLHEEMNPLAISIFDWIKTPVGQEAFSRPLQASEITVAPERTEDINVAVTIHGDETKTTQLALKSDPIELPTITLGENEKFLGYARTENATEPEIELGLGVALTYDHIEALLNGETAITLYPVIIVEEVNTDYDLVVYVHAVSSSKINEAEVNLFKDRFEATLTEEKNINYVLVTDGKADDFTARVNADLEAGETIDVIIGGNKSTATFAAIDETYINASCATYHFDDSSRKIVVLNSCATAHAELAKQFYTFMTTEAPKLELSVAYWHKDYSWVTEAEITAINSGITSYINTLFEVEDALATYNLSLDFFVCENTKVGELSAETKALNDGAGVGIIVGTGGNATDADKMGESILEHKDCPVSLVAAGRKVSLCNDNSIYTALFENYFAEAAAE